MLCYAAGAGNADFIGSDFSKEQSKGMGPVKTRRLAAMQSAAALLVVNFLDLLFLGSQDCEGGRGFVSVAEKNPI